MRATSSSRLLALVAALGVLAVLPCSAQARHAGDWPGDEADEPCPEYTTEAHFHTNDDTVTAAVVLAAEGVYEVLDRVDQTVAKGVAAGVVAGAEVADLVVNGLNRVADACYEPRHLQLEDELMKFTIQANLAVTTTADSSFVLPEKRQDGHIGPVPEHRTGWLDRERDGAESDHEQRNGADEIAEEDHASQVVGVKTSVRFTIDAMKSTGQCTCTAAESSYTQAVAAVTARNYKTAYRLFRQAYVYAFSN
jgi:hypothetical protein